MRLLALSLAALVVLIQYPLWLGKGGWLRVYELERSLAAQQKVNARLTERNAGLEGEVRDLKQGYLAVEERARYELGMVRPDEVFVQINRSIAPPAAPVKPAVPATPASTTVRAPTADTVIAAAEALPRSAR
jgi:cell division protein FtsB